MEGNNFNETDLSMLIQFGDESSEIITDECTGGLTQLLLCAGEIYYGQFVLLGYNGAEVTGEQKNPANTRKHLSKMFFKRRLEPNGIKKGSVVKLSGNDAVNKAKALRDSNRHTVAFGYGKNGTVVVEYLLDSTKDMFQIGRSSEDQIDFTIVDTWLASGNGHPSPCCGHNKSRQSSHREEHSNTEQKTISSTISRYACRILAERDKPHRVQIFAAGFDSSRNIFLGEKATKWQKKNGEFDGLTTNGVLILHPNWCNGDELSDDTGEMYIWREVSVDGDIYTLRSARSSTQRGAVVLGETNELQDGTLIDLCGATLLWRSAEGLKQSPSKAELERRLDELNAGKPQCPVNLNTLVIPRKRHNKSSSSSKQPYNGSAVTFRCPICLVDSERVAQLTMGMESAFHLDSGLLEYSFNPCGHMASKRTVRYWSRITMPHGTNSFHPVCPFCTSLLAIDKPFVRLIFQDHCYEN
uniref:Pellino n=1 Tax=Meloidogyne hapla TaxID=6305 RepID=A0A1I8C2F0_MELHA